MNQKECAQSMDNDNPMQTDGFAFLEFASPKPALQLWILYFRVGCGI